MVTGEDGESLAESELREAISELTARKHYLAELARIGKLGGTYRNA